MICGKRRRECEHSQHSQHSQDSQEEPSQEEESSQEEELLKKKQWRPSLCLPPPCRPPLSWPPLLSNHREQYSMACLALFLHNDVISCVLGYAAEIHMHVTRTMIPERDHQLNHQLNHQVTRSWAICLHQHKKEIFIADLNSGHSTCTIQVFHQTTGKFLRSWGKDCWITESVLKSDGFSLENYKRSGTKVSLSIHSDSDQLFVCDEGQRNIQIFSSSDCRLVGSLVPDQKLRKPTFTSVFITADGKKLYALDNENAQVFCFCVDTKKQLSVLNDLKAGETDLKAGGRGLCVDEQEQELFFTNPAHRSIQVVNLHTGKFLRQYGWCVSAPERFVIFGDQVIVCDRTLGAVVLFHRETADKSVRVGGQATEITYPTDLAISSCNKLFVCDFHTGRISVIG